MNCKATAAFTGARLVDSLPFSQGGTAAQAARLKSSGVDGVSLYLGVASKAIADAALAAGLGVIGVTLANNFDGAAAVASMRALGLAPGTSVFLDIEGTATYNTPSGTLLGKINSWADTVAAAGFLPGLYVGVPQPLTSAELYSARVVRYWHGQGSIRDHNGQLAEPSCGWCITQAWPSVFWPNSADTSKVWVDVNGVSQDYKGRAPSWCVATP